MAPDPRQKVLLVDDDVASLETARAALAGSFEVQATHSPTQALQHLRGSEFHVVCAAQKLVGMSGIELYDRVRADPKPPAFVLFTAEGEGEPTDFTSSELVASLEKPIDAGRLSRLVEQLARLAQLRRNIAAVARPGSRANPVVTPSSGTRVPTRETEKGPGEKADPSKKI